MTTSSPTSDATEPLRPVTVTPEMMQGWSPELPSLVRLARLWNTVSPRGKGAFPRWLGRSFGQKWRMTIALPGGGQLAVVPSALDIYVTILREGSWEPWIIRAIKTAVRPGDVLFDIGANVGYVSLEVAASQPTAKIFSFEPQPLLAPNVAISAKLSGFDNIQVLHAAAGETDGVMSLFMPAHALHASLKGEPGTSTVPCRVLRLDGLVDRGELPPPNVIKIDVEGAEWDVLKGATQILSKYRPVLLFEVNDNAARFGYTAEILCQWLRARADYQFFRIAPGDLLAAPPERASEFSELPQVKFDPQPNL